MMENIILLLGITGVIAIAANFILEATDKLSKDHRTFAVFNLYGSGMLLLYSWYNLVWLFVILNSFLVSVGLYGLFKVYKNKIYKSSNL